jgi:hypothetical protein
MPTEMGDKQLGVPAEMNDKQLGVSRLPAAY